MIPGPWDKRGNHTQKNCMSSCWLINSSRRAEPTALVPESWLQAAGSHIGTSTQRDGQQPAGLASADLLRVRPGRLIAHGGTLSGRLHSGSFPDDGVRSRRRRDEAILTAVPGGNPLNRRVLMSVLVGRYSFSRPLEVQPHWQPCVPHQDSTVQLDTAVSKAVPRLFPSHSQLRPQSF